MKDFLGLKLLTVFFLILLSSHAGGTTTATWTQSKESEFNKGITQNVSIHSTGEIQLSPKIEEITGIKSTFIWSMAADAQNQVFVGTGDPGTVHLIKNGSEAVELFKSPELYIQSLTTDTYGNLYVGTSPRGVIYKINNRGEATVFCNVPAPYIWDMAMDSDSNLFAVTGDEGILFKISPDGTPDVFFDTAETNLLSILIDQDDNLYVGTEPNGLIYKIAPSGQTQVLYDANESEIHCLATDSLGNVYAGTASGAQIQVPAATVTTRPPPQAGSVSPVLKEGLAWDLNIPEELPMAQPIPIAVQRPVSRSIGAPSKVAGVPNIPNYIYKITREGLVKRIFEIDQAFILGISLDKQNNLYAVTANNSGIYKIGQDETSSSLSDVEEVQVLCCLSTQNDEVYIGTGNMGKVCKISPSYVKEGAFLSNVLDTATLSNWGCISWTSKQPEGTHVILATRSGNCEKPDVTWDNWSPPYLSSGQRITSSPARFIQYKAILDTTNTGITPSLNTVSLSYLPKNHPPAVIRFTIEKDVSPLQKSSKINDRVESKPSISAGQKPHYQIAQKSIQWEVEDQNNDTVQVTVYYKGVGEKAWKIIDKNTQKKGTYAWDTLRLPDGEYQIKLVVSDEPDNPPETALSAENITQPVVIDNSRPIIQSLSTTDKTDGRYVISGSVKDGYSTIGKVQYTIDGQEWISAYPVDGVFDSTEESFQITTKPLVPGDYTLVINAFDSEGNIGAEKVMIERK